METFKIKNFEDDKKGIFNKLIKNVGTVVELETLKQSYSTIINGINDGKDLDTVKKTTTTDSLQAIQLLNRQMLNGKSLDTTEIPSNAEEQ